MKPQSDVALRIMQFVLAVLAAIVSLVLVTDAQIAGVLGLGTTDLGDAPVLLGRLRLVFRLALLFFLILVFLGVFSLIRRSLFPDVFVRGGGTGNAIKIVATDSGINAAIEAISAIRKPQTLRLWGYSLGWAARLSQHLEGNPNSQLAIEVFVPDESLIGSLFNDPKAAERAAVLRLRLDEWKTLATSRRVRSVQVFAQKTIPNDLGLMLDDRFALVHTYDWNVDGSRLTHKRQEIGKRRFLMISDGGETGRYVLEQFATRFLCRSYDSAPLPST